MAVGHRSTRLRSVSVIVPDHLVEEGPLLETGQLFVPEALFNPGDYILCQQFNDIYTVLMKSFLDHCLVLADALVVSMLLMLLLNRVQSAPGGAAGRDEVLECD